MAHRRAFTLIELVITMAIAAILAAIALPKVAGVAARRRADLTVRKIDSALELTASLAYHTSTPHRLSVDLLRDTVTISRDDGTKLDVFAFADDPTRADLTGVNFGGTAEILFDAFGVPDAGGVIEFDMPAGKTTVVIEPDTGRVQ